MQGLLLRRRFRDPKNIIILIVIDVANMTRNDVVFVAGWTLEGKLAFDCYFAAVRIDGGKIRADVVFGLRFGKVCSCFAVTVDKSSPAENLADDADLL